MIAINYSSSFAFSSFQSFIFSFILKQNFFSFCYLYLHRKKFKFQFFSFYTKFLINFVYFFFLLIVKLNHFFFILFRFCFYKKKNENLVHLKQSFESLHTTPLLKIDSTKTDSNCSIRICLMHSHHSILNDINSYLSCICFEEEKKNVVFVCIESCVKETNSFSFYE